MNARQSGHTPATPVGKAGGVGGGGGGGSATVAASVLAAAAHRAATAHALSASGGRSPAAHAAFGVRTPTPRTIRLDPDSDVDELVAAPVTPRAKTPARLVVAPISASAFAARTPVRLPARGDRPPTPEMRLPRSREPPAGIKRPRDAAASPTLLPPPLGARSAPPRASVLTAALSTSRTKRVIALDDDDDDADGFKEGAFNSLSGGRGGYAASVPKSPSSTGARVKRQRRLASIDLDLDKSQLAANVRRARNAIMRRITAGVQTLPQLDGAEAEAVKAESMLFDLLRQTVMQGQGNSVILCGPRDSGKTTILRSALCRLKAAVESKLDDTSDNKRAFIEVHLNGLAHTDDRSALRSIIKQLRLESTFEGHAVTSFSDTLAHILGIMSSGNVNSTPIVFVLDEFEHFAQHAKQVLLYNLFDTAQKRENPIAVVGLACGLDSVELLEKRVKSRFSHRMIHVRHPRLDTLRRTVRALVTLSPADDGISDAAFVEAFNDAVESALEDPRVAAALDAAAELDRSMGSVLQGALTCIASLSPLSPFPCADALVQHLTAASPALADHALTSTRNASVLELCMLVACKHLLARQVSMFNFEMAYDEYREFARQAANMGRGGNLVFAKRVALKAFENLVEMRLLRACEGVASCCPKEYRMFRCIITRAQIEKSVLAARDICPEAVVAWGTRR